MRQLAPVLALAALCAAEPVSAARADEFSASQRAEIVAVVRDALVKDPTILRDAVAALQEDGVRQAEDEASKHLGDNRAALLAAPCGASAGDPSGDVTLVEFYDPRCPYCRRMVPVVDGLLAADHHLRVVYKDIPVLGPASAVEASAILAAGLQGGYVRMQAAMLSDPAEPSEEKVRQAAVKLGLDADRLAKDMSNPAVVAAIKDNLELARRLKVQGTPVFVVGDRVMTGASDGEALMAAVSASRKGR
jgi:protein-disulfide isomerase